MPQGRQRESNDVSTLIFTDCLNFKDTEVNNYIPSADSQNSIFTIYARGERCRKFIFMFSFYSPEFPIIAVCAGYFTYSNVKNHQIVILEPLSKCS